MRFSAMATYDLSISHPTNLRRSNPAATAEEPEPINGSATKPPGLVNALTSRCTNATGNWQGWSVFSTWRDLTFGISHTSEGFLPSGLPLNSPLFGPL